MRKIDNVIARDKGALFWTVLGVLGFSGTLPATRLAAPHLGALQVGLGRALVAASCGVMLLLLTKAPWPSWAQWRGLVVVSLGVVIGFPWLSAWALKYTTAGKAGVIIALTPLFTAVLASWRERVWPGLRFWSASLFGTACVVLYLFSSVGDHAVDQAVLASLPLSWLPELALVLAALCAAFGYTEGARLTRQLGGLQVISWALLAAVPVIVPLLLSQDSLAVAPPLSAWLAFSYVSFVSMFFAFYFWYGGLSRAGVVRASQVQLLQPLLTVLWAALFLDEKLSLGLLLACLGVLGAIFVTVAKPNPSPLVRGSRRG